MGLRQRWRCRYVGGCIQFIQQTILRRKSGTSVPDAEPRLLQPPISTHLIYWQIFFLKKLTIGTGPWRWSAVAGAGESFNPSIAPSRQTRENSKSFPLRQVGTGEHLRSLCWSGTEGGLSKREEFRQGLQPIGSHPRAVAPLKTIKLSRLSAIALRFSSSG